MKDSSSIVLSHKEFDSQSTLVRPGRGEFHENPSTCICEDSVPKEKRDSGSRKYRKGNNSTRKDEVVDNDQDVDDDPEWPDNEEDDNQSGLALGLDYDMATSEEPELEDMLSD